MTRLVVNADVVNIKLFTTPSCVPTECDAPRSDSSRFDTLILLFAATEIITRDCLSSFKALRTDIPADHYEGCKPASTDLKLAHYVNNTIKELDVKM